MPTRLAEAPQPVVRGDKLSENIHEAAAKVTANNRRRRYENHQFTIPSGSTNLSINDINHTADCTCGRASGFLGVIGRAARVSHRNVGDAPITLKYNLASGDPITLDDGERHDWDFTEVEDIKYTNASGIGVTIRVLAA